MISVPDHPFLPAFRKFLAPVALLVAACAPQGAAGEPASVPVAQEEPARHPTSGLRLIEVAVVRGDERITFTTELADTQQAQARGMMFRTEMADDEAMLFPSEVPQGRSFWMRNTPLALDIIFIGVDGRISNIEDGVPYRLESVRSVGLASAVLEIRGGLSEELGIVPGDRVEYELP